MSEQCKFKRYIWELPVRWCHWLIATSIVTLSVTGVFIGNPVSIGGSASDFGMGWIRFVHFVAGYLFATSLLTRVLWSLVGNEYSGWRAFFPLATAKGRKKTIKMLRYYLLIDKEVPETIGHNPLAATAYTLVFCVYIILILTGFAMFSFYNPGGLMHKSLGFMYHLFSTQDIRLIHHMGMWFIWAFVVNHFYSAWLMDIKEQGSEISSMFSGFRFTVHKED
jgi:Ni/Fe-hydrogenase 1 B-type cytochrome subunit